MNILVLCTGNSARSILLEYILNASGKVTAFSAGSKPAGKVHPQSLTLLNALGYDTTAARSKSWDEFAAPDAPVMDMVISVCGAAGQEPCPIWPGAPLRSHWGVDDPAAVDQPIWDVAFQTAYDRLKRRADAFLALPLGQMDRTRLQTELNRIGML